MSRQVTFEAMDRKIKVLEEELNLLFNMSIDMICIIDIQSSRFLKVNPAFTESLGHETEAFVGKAVFDFIHPDDLESTRHAIADLLRRGEKVIGLKNRFCCLDGNYRWLRWVARPVPDKGITLAVAHDVTQETQAQEALQASALLWQATFDAVNDSIAVLDVDWNIVQVNRVTSEVFGHPIEEIVGRKCYEVIHGNDAPIDNCPLRTTIKNMQRATERTQIGGRWFEITADPITRDGRTIDGIVHIVSDITKRLESERELRQREGTLRSIFSAASIGIGMVRNRVIVQANQRLCDMLGYRREELIDHSARVLYPSQEAFEYVGEQKYRQIEAKGTGTVETQWRNKKGEIIDVLLSSTPINPQDWAEGITFTALDITDRKKAEAEIAHAHQRFLTVLDSIDATIYVVDMQSYEILFMNKQMIESFGGDFTGKVCWQVFKEKAPCAHCTNDKLVDGEGRPTGTYVWQGLNEVTGKWCINHDRAIEWVDGRLVRLQIATDITELKRLEGQLQQSQKMEAIGTLAGGIAHDFNNILSAIIGYSELSLDEVAKGSDLSRNLVEIHTAAMRARDLVAQILTFARQANQDLKPLKVSIIANEVMKLLRSTLPATIEIQYRFDTQSLVMADPTQIHQIFMNLCTNAAHAMEDDGGRLDVYLTNHTFTKFDPGNPSGIEPGEYLKITITDTGKGIPEEIQPFIFEPYFTTKPPGEGTGLGLSVVHGIVKERGGDIKVESSANAGTTFTIYLPAIKSETAQRAPQSSDIQTGTERILFVDDERSITRMASQILERMGYTVTTFTGSMDALAYFRAAPNDFDLVITDMTMPQMTGDRLAAEVMKIRPELPVIICTGFSKKLSDEQVQALGIKAVAMKPIAREDLSKTVRKVLDEANAIRT